MIINVPFNIGIVSAIDPAARQGMKDSTYFTKKVPLLVLAEGVPPGGRHKKMCLTSIDCEVSLKIVPRPETSVAFTIPAALEGNNAGYYERYGELPFSRQNIVSHEEGLYLDVALGAMEMVKRMRADPFFRIGRSSQFRDEFQRAILAFSPRGVWPDDLHAYAKRTRFVHLDENKKKLATMVDESFDVKFTVDGLQQIEAAQQRFRASLEDIVVIDEHCHVMCGEPLYRYKPDERRIDVRVWDSAFWTGGKRTSHVPANGRFFLASQEDDLRQAIGRPDAAVGTVGIVEPAAVGFPLEEMEFYRIAGDLVSNVSIWLGKRDVIQNIDRDTLNAYADLRDLIVCCDPLSNGVPASIEEKFEALVHCIPRIPKVPHEVYVTAADIEYARGMWENRPILTSLAAHGRRMG